MEAQQDSGSGDEAAMGPVLVTLDLAGATSALAGVRTAVGNALTRWGLEGQRCIPRAELVVTELVANAVRHGGGAVSLTVSADRTSVTLAVTDASRTPPARRQPDEGGGHGLVIIEALAASWGYTHHPDAGKTVWARLPTGADPP